MTAAYVSWSVEVERPGCGESLDLADQDDDQIVARAVFNNRWEDLHGHEAACPKCAHEFTLSSVTC